MAEEKTKRNLEERINDITRSTDSVSDPLGRTVLRKRAEKLQPALQSAAEAQLSTAQQRQNRRAVNVNVREEIDRLADSYSRPFRIDNNTAKAVRRASLQGAREGFQLGRMRYEELLALGQKERPGA